MDNHKAQGHHTADRLEDRGVSYVKRRSTRRSSEIKGQEMATVDRTNGLKSNTRKTSERMDKAHKDFPERVPS